MGPLSYMRSVVDLNVGTYLYQCFSGSFSLSLGGLEVSVSLKMEAAGSSETSIVTHHITCCHNVELHNPYVQRPASTEFRSNRIQPIFHQPVHLPLNLSQFTSIPKSSIPLFVLIELQPSQSIILNVSLDEAKSDPAALRPRVLLGHQTYIILTLVVGSFGQRSLPLTERSVLRDLGVTSLINTGTPNYNKAGDPRSIIYASVSQTFCK
jgi:hypothetical protein